MVGPVFILLSEANNDESLFKKILKFLCSIDPENWTEEKVMHFFDDLGYDCLVCIKGNEIIGSASFNPDRKEGVVKLFSFFVSPRFRGRGFAKLLGSEFLKWVKKSGFKKAQIGKGRNTAARGILEAMKRDKNVLGLSFADINAATGRIIIDPC
jgi:GNAT superfamily N-acetyltransferase